MRLKLNRAAAITLTGTAILATLNQVGGGAAPRSYIEGQDYENNNGEQVKADDLDGVTDPSKLSESDFAPGTKWTNAGWTRSNPQYVANSSNIQLMKEDTHKLSPQNNTLPIQTTDLLGLQGSWSIKADDLSTSHKILLSSIQFSDNYDNNNIAKNRIGYLLRNDNSTRITYKEEHIGDLIIEGKDNREVDIWFKPAMNNENNGVKKYAGNISFSMYLPRFIWLNYVGRVRVDQLAQLKQKDFKQYLIFNNKIYKRTYTPQVSWTPAPTPNMSYNNDFNIDPVYSLTTFLKYSVNPFLLDNNNKYMSFDAKPNNRTFIRVLKINGKNFGNNNVGDIYTDVYVPIYNANNQVMHSGQDNTNVYNYAHIEGMPLKNITQNKLSNNLSAYDLINQAKMNSVSYSTQSDGSMLLGIKINYEGLALPEDLIRNYLSHTAYYPNIDDPTHKQQIIDNTMKHLHEKKDQPDYIVGLQEYLGMLNNIDPAYWTATDVTPLNLEWNGEAAPMSSGFKDTNSSSANAELYRTAVVHYLDSKTGNNISNDSIMGTKNNSTDYKLNIPKGYVLDTKSGKNTDRKQYKWSADKRSIAYTFNEDQTVNDANPINIYITHGTHNTNDNSGKSTRTIQYTGLPDNLKPKDNVQTVLFKRSGVTDDVTGETTYGDWQPQSGNGHYTAVPSPTFAGYKPDQEVISDEAATPNKNENVTVNYSRTNQQAKLTVHDDTTNTDLSNYAENSTGKYQDQINFKTAPSAVEQELKDKGYNIVSDSFKGSPTYNADDSKNNFVIHVTHKIVPVTPDHPKTPADVIPDTKQHYPNGVDTNDLNKDVQRSIFYKYEDNSQAEPMVVQKAHFDRTVKVDAATQKIVDNGTWATKDNYSEVATQSIDGYTPDKTKVDSATPSMTTNQDQTVVYHANDEDAAITYIDDTTGKVLKTDTQKAKYKQTIKFATDPNTQIQVYKDQGYVLVSSDWKDDSTYQTDPARNKFTVHLKHGTSTVTPDKPKKPTDIIPGTKQHYPTGVDTNDLNQSQQRQITYTYADSKKQASSTVTQKATFHRTATVDNVTGKTTYTDWTTSDQYPEVKSPDIEGYTPDKQTVPATKPELNQKQDVSVVYNPNPEQVDVIAQDNTGKQLSKSTLHGNYNTEYTATTPVIKGYHLIKMPTNTHGTYKTHNDPIIYIYAPDSNSVPEQTDGTPKPDKSSYPNDLTPAKRSNKLPETGSINLQSELKSEIIKAIHNLLQ